MRSLSNNETFRIYGATIGPEFDLAAGTDLAAIRDEWDLSQLASVETVRSSAAAAERVRKRSSAGSLACCSRLGSASRTRS